MLRGLVLLALAVNVALYFWIRADSRFWDGEREPERLGRQVAPEAIQVLPDALAPSASVPLEEAPASLSAAPAAPAGSAGSAPSAASR